MRELRHIILAAALLALGGCSKPDTAPGPGGVTMGEARALDDAAAMLDERRPPAEALQPAEPAEPAVTGPPLNGTQTQQSGIQPRTTAR